MGRFFVWVRCEPVECEDGSRVLLAIRTIKANDADEAIALATLQVRQDLIRDFGAQGVSKTAFVPTRVSQPAWFNFRRVNVNLIVQDDGHGSDAMGDS